MRKVVDRNTKSNLLACAAVLMALTPASTRAWGTKGHEIQARSAVATLPADMPAFFRESSEELAYLIVEPDRWRFGEERALDEATGPNHSFKYEIAPRPLPANRHLFIIAMAKNPQFDPSKGSTVGDFGTAPYAIQEWAEMLTSAFRRWRIMPESTDAEIARKRIHEQSILFMAGVLGHWVTDVSQPMHSSIHTAGWHLSVPNPKGYSGPDKGDLHRRYETQYVDRAITLEDVAPLVGNPPRVLRDWLEEAEQFVAANTAHVERIFIWEQQAPFGRGNESAEAKPFTAARLADGARLIRDFWYTSWVRSAVPLPK